MSVERVKSGALVAFGLLTLVAAAAFLGLLVPFLPWQLFALLVLAPAFFLGAAALLFSALALRCFSSST